MGVPDMSIGKILVCDDDRNICELLRLYLEKEGYAVVIANDGEEALAKFSSENPDLMLLDIMMPKLDGWQVCREVRKKALLQLQADVDLSDLSGDLAAKAKFCAAPLDQMVADKEISAYEITAPEADNADILTTKTLRLLIRYVPIGKVRAIQIDLACAPTL